MVEIDRATLRSQISATLYVAAREDVKLKGTESEVTDDTVAVWGVAYSWKYKN